MRFIVPLVASLLAVAGISATPIDKNVHSGGAFSDIRRARAHFNARLLKSLDHMANDHNVVVSPFGLHSALSAVLAGAQGKTYDQLSEAPG